ncbi:hypothetical protein, partial [Thiolapillus sp.]|uniref:hypothetical protein n=1 Tax=Thiolapillus sp. TaxID=2017437 RepID=UPI003AF8D44C
ISPAIGHCSGNSGDNVPCASHIDYLTETQAISNLLQGVKKIDYDDRSICLSRHQTQGGQE